MGEEESLAATVPFDRTVEQAILVIKKGAHLLKCRRRGKPKFCPFRLSTDAKFLIWYSGRQEKQLRLSSVGLIIAGQKTVNFRRQLQPDKEHQSFSLIYANGERSIDLICKDKAQADSWFLGLKAVISRCHHSRSMSGLRNRRGAQSCVNSPAGYIQRKHTLGLLEGATEFSQVRSLCGSPSLSLSERCLSDGLSYSSDSFYFPESGLLHKQNVTDIKSLNSPYFEPNNASKWGSNNATEFEENKSLMSLPPIYRTPQIEKNDVLKDVMIWGLGAGGGNIGGVVDKSCDCIGAQSDAWLPQLLESTMMLDVQNISLGAKHAALVTKQGEVFCWGEGSGGRLGHKVNMDINYPKLVESLCGVRVKSVTCGDYQTCALTQSGEVLTWGDFNHGVNFSGVFRNRIPWLPCKISVPLPGVSISSVACGDWHTAILSSSGQLFTYGDGRFGALGHGNLQSVFQPKEVESLKGLWVKSVACGPWHTAAIVEIMVDRCKFNAIGGKLFTWGDGDKGRLGHADGARKLLPTCIAQLVDHDFVQVSCGRMLTVGLTNLGMVYTMGSSVHGQLGNPQAKDKSIMVVEGKLKDEFIKEISSGSYHIAVLTSGGSVYTWGKGANGQLGLGDIQDRHSPTLIEALRDRQVESVTCGSSLTAAICLHKSVSVDDRSACSGCRMPFGFTRKKRNCYNCGLLFCSSCSNKKVINASLAPNKMKAYRVCASCFNHLQKITHSDRLLKLDEHSPRQLMIQNRTPCDEKDVRGEVTPTRGGQLLSMKQSCKVENQSCEPVASLSLGQSKWGQVPCPVLFDAHSTKDFMAVAPPKELSCSIRPQSLQKTPVGVRSDSGSSNSTNEEKALTESNKMLTEEIERLRAEAKSLENQCQIGSQRIEECQRKIDEAWSLAKQEAAKSKAATEIIKALKLRVHTMLDKISAVNLPQLVPVNTDSCNLESVHPMFGSANLPSEVKLLKERQVDSLCASPIVFSNTLKSMYGSNLGHENHVAAGDSRDARTECGPNGTKAHEWVEQHETGVYITFTILPNGQKGLKRVRFSRKRFIEKEAQRWWEENQVLVYQKYGIEGYISSNQSQMKG